MPSAASDDHLEQGRLLFAQQAKFVKGVVDKQNLPESLLPEVAFAGRSNVGKSSLLNALTGRKSLARASNRPGRTQELNFFDLGGRLMLVDLPGYGYAGAPKAKVAAWTALTRDYLRGRTALSRVCLLIDARHGLKPNDREVMALLDDCAVVYSIVLTKCDKINQALLEKRLTETGDDLARHPAAHPAIFPTSSQNSSGIAQLRAALADLL